MGEGQGLGEPDGLDEVEAREDAEVGLGGDVDMRNYLLARAEEADALKKVHRVRSGGGIAHAENVPAPVSDAVHKFAKAVLDMMGGRTDEEITEFERVMDPKSENDKRKVELMRAHRRGWLLLAVGRTRQRLVTALNRIGYDWVRFEGLDDMETRVYSNTDVVDVRFHRTSEAGAVVGKDAPSFGWVSIAKNVITRRSTVFPIALKRHSDVTFVEAVTGRRLGAPSPVYYSENDVRYMEEIYEKMQEQEEREWEEGDDETY